MQRLHWLLGSSNVSLRMDVGLAKKLATIGPSDIQVKL